MGTIGILAQSIGGGGGSGAFAGGMTFSNSSDVSNTVGAGAGGAAGDGADVHVTNSAAITANGAQGVGILAQSVGGAGGNGGFSISGGASFSADTVTQSVGGAGGAGGNAGAVTVTNNLGGMITTNGAMAYGVIAQSVGGSGGNGGFAIDGNVSLGGKATSIVGGGAGGTGGSAGVVQVDNYDMIYTKGMQSVGILAQSVGGGGGAGGVAVGAAFSTSGDVNSTVGGGSGGTGNTPSSVTVTNHKGAVIVTSEANSIGILAQAIGGGGGLGGLSISGAGSSGGKSLAQSVGGTGGTGGSSTGTLAKPTVVTVENDGAIFTGATVDGTGHIVASGGGQNSIGIFAQSVGGGGGVAGTTVAGAFGSGNGTGATVGGAAGGGGGNAGAVKVINNGSITTYGANSVGILAQSVGGGGGAASFSGAFNFTGGGNLTNTVGGGGNGGNGGDVTVINKGSIITYGQDSVAILAQSIGGGGGSSLFSIGQWTNSLTKDTIALGSSGSGAQGAQGTVVVDISGGFTQSTGDLSYGLLGQSIGAGGGNAALSVPDPLMVGSGGLTETLGSSAVGSGASAQYGNANPITTTGAGAIGFMGQSIGGGGGASGVTGDATFSGGGSFSVTLGATGGGDGGKLAVANTATGIQTGGDYAHNIASGDGAVAMLGQSIGGGGGSAIAAISLSSGTAGTLSQTLGGSESALSNGAQLVFTSGGQITTYGRFAPGLVGQTIGGGGGFSAMTFATGVAASGVSFQLGSTGGAGGSADPLQSSAWTINTGAINTSGKLSDGLVAQGIGAGGGLTGFVSDGTQNPPLIASQLGAAGNAVGNGSAVTFTSAGFQSSITTTGGGAAGLIAQSIGGGGGVAQAYGVSGGGPVTLGATGAASGDGRDVNVITQQTVSTSGAYAYGIVAQSIGGGGGLLQAFDANGNALRLQLLGGAGGGGNGGNVSVTSNAAIGTTGAGAHGIVAQSVAGGGGIVGGGVFATSLPITTTGFAGSAGGAGTAGTVTVNSQANITTMGLNSTAVFAELIDRFGLGGVIGVTLGNAATGTALTTLGGGGLGNGVAFVGGSSNAASPNTLINYTTLTTTSLINGMTITGAFGSEDVSNYGHLIGSVNLVGGPSQLPLPDHPGEVNTIENMPFHSNPSLFSGVFDSGPSIVLSNNVAPPAADIFTNGGLISPGALLNVFTTNVAGNFVQTVSPGGCGSFGNPTTTCGYYGVDFDMKPQVTDRLNVSGTATVSGAVVVNVMNPGYALPGASSKIIVHTLEGETHPNLILQAQPSAVAGYSLGYTPFDITLNTTVNFAPAGLTLNQTSVGNAINRIQMARFYPGFRAGRRRAVLPAERSPACHGL